MPAHVQWSKMSSATTKYIFQKLVQNRKYLRNNKNTAIIMVKKVICPKCMSEDIKFDWPTAMVGESVVDSYTCKKCGYTARFFPEVDDKK